VAREGYTVSALVTHLPQARAIRHAIVLFPGHPGILRLEATAGEPRYDLRGNFLVRSRRHWLDDETLTAVLDAPSDQWTAFSQDFRRTGRYGADVRAMLDELARRHPGVEFAFVGTSEGSVSAYQAARMNPTLARRVILTASVFVPTRSGPGLSGADWQGFAGRLLWVHHEDDPCEFTAYHDARRFAAASGGPLVTVRGGGPGRGGACQAFTAHGFVGVERETVLAMRQWVKSGATPPDVAP
jgi:pimeloyl-ACP methyl ester carboxylesterase